MIAWCEGARVGVDFVSGKKMTPERWQRVAEIYQAGIIGVLLGGCLLRTAVAIARGMKAADLRWLATALDHVED